MLSVTNPIDVQNRLAKLEPKIQDRTATAKQKRQLHKLDIAIRNARHEADLLNDLLEQD
jgi:hypothetical protein